MVDFSLLKIESYFDHLSANSEKSSTILTYINKIHFILDELEETEIKNGLLKIVEEIKVLVNGKWTQSDIENCYKRAKEVLFRDTKSVLKNFNEKLSNTNINDFYIINQDMFSLTLAGSFDSDYYHDVEVKFLDVEFICCPNHFTADSFRIATENEIYKLGEVTNIKDSEGLAICMEDTSWGDKYYMIAHSIEVSWGTVFYYMRENLGEGQRIANWVLEKNRSNR
ncbi:hypothetical protein [Vallitalea maricola]|uniref:Uncharacterized protein n=1 Tax=Vallitalea maricola TaxID=3074433 RepID=A0ACB5UP01_9FIRM|nr:hypothetical protein AN2V17_34850 [Vallitalea sp. AN17-2]